ncbi:unnamed protein product [Sympodiomycopsis kandeliae]
MVTTSRSQSRVILTFALLFTLLVSSVSAIDRITRKGKYLLQPNGERFYIKGVAYQESTATTTDAATGGFPEPGSFVDPLAMPSACKRDVAQLTDLGVNTIRVYSVNSTLDHDDCMKTFSDANIHVIIDLALPGNSSINRAEPVWDTALQTVYLDTIDAFAKYDNVLAYSVANELVSVPSVSGAATFLKAAVRDVKSYLKSKKQDYIMVTTSLIDGASGPDALRQQLAAYLTCDDEATSIDLYGHNTYSWEEPSSLSKSGWDSFAQDFADYPVAIYFAEFGYVGGSGSGRPQDRTWEEVGALLAPPMTDSVSGGCAFGYFPKDSAAQGKDYGLVDIDGDTVTPRGGWNDLKTQFAQAKPPTDVPSSGTTSSYSKCAQPSGQFLASPNLPPTPDPAYCSCLQSNAWPCQATQASDNSPEILGLLLGQACSYIGQQGGNCDDLTANGTTGVYGNVSFCAPHQRLSWAMSELYELSNYTASSCDFAGNATLPRGPVTNSSSLDIAEQEQKCSSDHPIGVKTPVVGQEGYTGSGTNTGSSSGGNDDSKGNGNAASASHSASMLAMGASSLAVVSFATFLLA